ncbi:LytTR family transcriptional regulator [Butyrivibrio sp. CB08]|uniref:LytTR family DNA-binding domain-containing protein n=1 Tax=Butyrivibrio sp. CB08 TaxID=2364879 RepID=UPI000EAAAD38|nr:LytTR family DNA-binding domain-containing protein [Butyrivibrio sp. CB08]RKM61376.1 LytTR family transcriptional regulator [Butyrivibrio sp. CB08]
MSDLLDIKLIIDKACEKLTVTIRNKERNDDVEGVIAAIEAYANKKIPMIPAYFKNSVVMLPQGQIFRLYISNRKVMIRTSGRVYEVRKNLSELEKTLDQDRFVRISQSEIINIRKVKRFDFSAVGTIGVEMENGESTWVARRRVRDVKNVLMKGGSHGSEN